MQGSSASKTVVHDSAAFGRLAIGPLAVPNNGARFVVALGPFPDDSRGRIRLDREIVSPPAQASIVARMRGYIMQLLHPLPPVFNVVVPLMCLILCGVETIERRASESRSQIQPFFVRP